MELGLISHMQGKYLIPCTISSVPRKQACTHKYTHGGHTYKHMYANICLTYRCICIHTYADTHTPSALTSGLRRKSFYGFQLDRARLQREKASQRPPALWTLCWNSAHSSTPGTPRYRPSPVWVPPGGAVPATSLCKHYAVLQGVLTVSALSPPGVSNSWPSTQHFVALP